MSSQEARGSGPVPGDADLEVREDRILRHGRLRLAALAVASTKAQQHLYALEPRSRAEGAEGAEARDREVGQARA